MVSAAGAGTPDGFRVDIDGNLWCGWGMGSDELDGVLVFSPDGDRIGRIRLPERCAQRSVLIADPGVLHPLSTEPRVPALDVGDR